MYRHAHDKRVGQKPSGLSRHSVFVLGKADGIKRFRAAGLDGVDFGTFEPNIGQFNGSGADCFYFSRIQLDDFGFDAFRFYDLGFYDGYFGGRQAESALRFRPYRCMS